MTEISGKNILIIGGGKSAFHKVRAFLGFGANITVIAEQVSSDISRMSEEIVVLQKTYSDPDLAGMDIVVAATDDKELNRSIALSARERGIPVNAVDDREYCDFIFPAILRKNNYSVAVSTDGRSPLMAGKIRNAIAGALPDSFDETVGRLGEMREEVLRAAGSPEERSRIFREEAEKTLGKDKIRIGTRVSALAMTQTELVMKALSEKGIESEAIILSTEGDRVTDRPLWTFGGKSVFVSEFEEALLSGRIDIAVHSAKDMPAELPEGLSVLACLKREDPSDVLVTLSGRADEDIRIVGTSSMRRKALIEERSDKYVTRPLRGNVPTRLNKLRRGEFDAVILAAAGLKRLGLDDEPDLKYTYLDPETFTPAAGQGIIAVEGRADGPAARLIRLINDDESEMALKAERGFMRRINAGCHDSVGAWAYKTGNDGLRLACMKHEGDVTKRYTAECSAGSDADIDAMISEAAAAIGGGDTDG